MEVNSWEAVDTALRRIGELEIAANEINGVLTLKINELKEESAKRIAPIDAEREHIEKLVTLFCEGNKADFADKRSKVFNFGEVGYRIVKSVGLPRVKEKIAALVKSLKAFGLGECVDIVETPNKEAIVELKDETLAKLGLKRTVKDSFRIVPKLEAVQGLKDAA
ncbi:MAG: host-nuclease inhibitor Gam family protein [Helicobacteraceae bacterium]|jgi:phage host-nuclease inhibitor protein Gam|nr:host-nuclease inhibitor Gam family protein [Helicobacteraceae bacterium]